MPGVTLQKFTATVKTYYQQHGRQNLPWRIPEPNGTFDPYKILVSEIMLQQTQVSRVIPKYQLFLQEFPNTYALSRASFAEVLALWSGLGYNRRAKFLLQAAQMVEAKFHGRFPEDLKQLTELPGVGINTAGAIAVYAFNQPVVFIETNIRTVFLHHFFPDEAEVGDAQLMPYIQQALDLDNPREWYWALMDYGTHLKASLPNPARRSKHHTKQSTFKGSRRELRGMVLKVLLSGKKSATQLDQLINDVRLGGVLADLCAEGLVTRQGATYQLGK